MTALYPGSFDPVTRGHMDIIARGAAIADTLIVAILDNPRKQPMFTLREREALLRAVIKPFPSARVETFSGLLAKYAREKGVDVILRGLRNAADFEYEKQMAQTNKLLTQGIETLMISADAAYAHISSGAVREIAAMGYACGFDDEPLAAMVPPEVMEVLRNKYANLNTR